MVLHVCSADSTAQAAPMSTLVDSFNRDAITHEDADARIDALWNQVSKNPGSKGYIFVYCAKKCSLGEVDAHLRGIRTTLNYKNFNAADYQIFNGGFREKTTTEFWMAPKDACPPSPTPTFDITDVKLFRSVFKRRTVIYHFSGG